MGKGRENHVVRSRLYRKESWIFLANRRTTKRITMLILDLIVLGVLAIGNTLLVIKLVYDLTAKNEKRVGSPYRNGEN